MLQTLMLDLGDTLLQGNALFPHVEEALTSLSSFKAADDTPLDMALVSDFDMASAPSTQEKIDAIFARYLLILEQFGLRQFFEPVTKRVTLSTHAEVLKPDRKIFEVALRRLGKPVDVTTVLFITENINHIKAVQKLGMHTLHFGHSDAPGIDFDDWSIAPLLIARLLSAPSRVNLERALRTYLSINHNMELLSIEQASSEDTVIAKVKAPFPISDLDLGELSGVRVIMPLTVTLHLDKNGGVSDMQVQQPSAEELADATHQVRTLVAHQKVSPTSDALVPGATHQIEIDPEGNRTLKRKRFSAR